MAFVLVRYTVGDFQRWKTSFNDAYDMRKECGEKSCRVFRSSNDPNEVVIIHEWDSLSAARHFVRSRRMRQCMENAGVVGKPDTVFLKEISRPL
ncbi:MAG: hypothetical protein C4526_06485 [Nitrospiraceae bacterium]|nr:MAG: hypothetical protein C4526_06485 [Nitrospiraceae bacterium]